MIFRPSGVAIGKWVLIYSTQVCGHHRRGLPSIYFWMTCHDPGAATISDVPAPHLEDGRALRVTKPETHLRHMHIKSGSGTPDEAFVAVRHQGYWFWIDETDVISKLALTFMMILFSLAEIGTEAQAPVLTIGAGF